MTHPNYIECWADPELHLAVFAGIAWLVGLDYLGGV